MRNELQVGILVIFVMLLSEVSIRYSCSGSNSWWLRVISFTGADY